ncbi:MAG: 4-amino-4-deoxy-L-arabinose-phospho-UDP flippase [Gammaproteobacteria bacterium]|nr:4-amino-4-deoxy-L-arabinose-phospho-UDP flippase [Gammaproteobacteria bacterium]NNJ50046.1 4-amino-4-deoxy-L-arabinose-phospho-UDP flippase [Gammaproteobacteria bacterium]
MSKIKSNAVILLALTIILSACAQLFMKVSMIQLQLLLDSITDEQSLLFIIMDNGTVVAWLFAGLCCYALSMLSWIFALIKYELSFAYPFLGITYVLVYLGAVYWQQIGEQLTLMRTMGILLILVGVVLVNYKNNSHQEAAL